MLRTYNISYLTSSTAKLTAPRPEHGFRPAARRQGLLVAGRAGDAQELRVGTRSGISEPAAEQRRSHRPRGEDIVTGRPPSGVDPVDERGESSGQLAGGVSAV